MKFWGAHARTSAVRDFSVGVTPQVLECRRPALGHHLSPAFVETSPVSMNLQYQFKNALTLLLAISIRRTPRAPYRFRPRRSALHPRCPNISGVFAMTSAPYRLLRFSQPGSRQGGDLPLRVLRTLAVAFLLGFKSSLKATFYDSTVGVFFSSLGKPHKTFFHLGSLPLPTANMAVVFRKPTVTETQEQEAAERTRGSMREVRFYQIILVL